MSSSRKWAKPIKAFSYMKGLYGKYFFSNHGTVVLPLVTIKQIVDQKGFYLWTMTTLKVFTLEIPEYNTIN